MRLLPCDVFLGYLATMASIPQAGPLTERLRSSSSPERNLGSSPLSSAACIVPSTTALCLHWSCMCYEHSGTALQLHWGLTQLRSDGVEGHGGLQNPSNKGGALLQAALHASGTYGHARQWMLALFGHAQPHCSRFQAHHSSQKSYTPHLLASRRCVVGCLIVRARTCTVMCGTWISQGRN